MRQVDDCFITFAKHVAACSIMTVHTLCKHKNGICMSFNSNGHDKENIIILELIPEPESGKEFVGNEYI